jgi:hypothetical protein
MAELLDSCFLLFLFLLLNGLEFKILWVNLLDIFHVLDFFISALSLFVVLLVDGFFGFEPDQFAFFELFPHFLNVFLFNFFMLFSDSFFELF